MSPKDILIFFLSTDFKDKIVEDGIYGEDLTLSLISTFESDTKPNFTGSFTAGEYEYFPELSKMVFDVRDDR